MSIIRLSEETLWEAARLIYKRRSQHGATEWRPAELLLHWLSKHSWTVRMIYEAWLCSQGRNNMRTTKQANKHEASDQFPRRNKARCLFVTDSRELHLQPLSLCLLLSRPQGFVSGPAGRDPGAPGDCALSYFETLLRLKHFRDEEREAPVRDWTPTCMCGSVELPSSCFQCNPTTAIRKERGRISSSHINCCRYSRSSWWI